MKTRLLLLLAVTATVAGGYFLGRQHPASPAAVPAPDAAVSPAARPVAPSLRSVLDLNDPLESTLRFSDYLRGLTAAQAAQDAPLLWTAQGELRELNERKRLFFLAWGRVDGPAAVAFVQTHHAPGKVACLGASLAGWASKNPTETMLAPPATRTRTGPKCDAPPWPGCRHPAVATPPPLLLNLLNSAVDTREPARQIWGTSVKSQRDHEEAILPHPRSA